MSDYTVLGGHEVAEFRQTADGTIELYSTEEREDGSEVGTVGTLTEDELSEAAETLSAVAEGDAEEVEAPSFDDIAMGQHALTGAILFIAVDDEGEKQMETGAAFGDPQDVIDAADSL